MRWIFFFFGVLFGNFSAHAKIYDCFLFFNEVEVLELRLHELYPYVDKFIIIEAAEGFRGQPKPYNFEKEQARFAPFADKIIYIKLSEHIETEDPWVREFWQRNQISRGLGDCQPNDLILISDVDEYIPGSLLSSLYQASSLYPMIGFWQKMYRWFVNRETGEAWAGTAALRYKHLLKSTPQEVRNFVRKAKIVMWHAGWHFTSMGGYERIVEKYCHFSHGSDTKIGYEEWRGYVATHPLVPIDGSFPRYIREHIPELIERGLVDGAFVE